MIDTLIPEIFSKILVHLNIRDVVNLAKVNKELQYNTYSYTLFTCFYFTSFTEDILRFIESYPNQYKYITYNYFVKEVYNGMLLARMKTFKKKSQHSTK